MDSAFKNLEATTCLSRRAKDRFLLPLLSAEPRFDQQPRSTAIACSEHYNGQHLLEPISIRSVVIARIGHIS